MQSNRQNLLPGVPIVESPFFDEMLGGGALDPELWRIACDLRQHGYAIFEFPDPDFASLSERIRNDLSEKFDFKAWREGKTPDLRIQDAWRFNADVRRIATNQNVLSMLQQLYGRAAFPFQTLSFPVGTQQHFHTDSIHFSSMPERFMCGVWVAMEDVGDDQGPLIYYPGSHNWPIYTNEHVGYSHFENKDTSQTVYEPLWRKLVQAHHAAPARFTPKAGQALIWAANLLHGGDFQRDMSKTRWSQVTHYFFEGCSYYTPMGSDAPYGSIAFRSPHNAMTGEKMRNMYNGHLVSEAYIGLTKPLGRAPLDAEAPLPDDFDPQAYLLANPDVADAGADPAEHYVRYGAAEGRKLRP